MHSSYGQSQKNASRPIPHYDFRKTGEVFDSLISDFSKPRSVEMPTGIIKLDGIIRGLHRGHMVVIAARPGGGKTALSVQIGWNLAKLGFKVFDFSLEMSKKEVITRVLCSELEMEHDIIHRGSDLTAELPRIKTMQEIFDKTPFIVFDDIGYRFDDIDHVVKDFGKNKPDVVIIDHVQLVDKRGFHNSMEAIEQYARKCKEFARSTNTVWIVLSQLNRDAANTTGSPRLENLKGSGALEEMADVVIMGSWDGFNGSQYTVEVAKHRHGRRGRFLLEFQPKYFKFKNIDVVVPSAVVNDRRGLPREREDQFSL